MITKKDLIYLGIILVLLLFLFTQSQISSNRIDKLNDENNISKGVILEIKREKEQTELNLLILLNKKDSVLNALKSINRTKTVYKYEKINSAILELPLDSSVILLTKNLSR